MKKIISIVLSFILIATFVLPLYVSAEETTQSNITTSFDEKTGTLTVSGNGKAYDVFGRNAIYGGFGSLSDQAYRNINKTVKHLVIEEGITEIYNCFNDMYVLEDVSFPKTLETIEWSFYDCDAIKKVEFPKSLRKIGYYSFYDCDGLTKIKFSGPAIIGYEQKNALESYVFCSLDSLEYVEIPSGSTLGLVFKWCPNLKKVVLGRDISYLYAGTDLADENPTPRFWGCNDDFKIYMPADVHPPFEVSEFPSNVEVIRVDYFAIKKIGIYVLVAVILLVIFIFVISLYKKIKRAKKKKE